MKEIFVYADWLENDEPKLVGSLKSELLKGNEIFSFEYDKVWLETKDAQQLDPDLKLFSGPQFLNDDKKNFGLFLDSSPDRWGRTLMTRRSAIMARENKKKNEKLFETDFLLGVNDVTRMGALRFKIEENGSFISADAEMSVPHFSSIRELEQATNRIERDLKNDSQMKEWLNLLMAPGSSLGGARPKANVIDPTGNLWIAKFPSKNDDKNSGAWEFIVGQMAIECGIRMADSNAKIFSQKHHTFLTKRFDRIKDKRIHFASAMTLLGYKDGHDYKEGGSYLDMVELIEQYGAEPTIDIRELWKRIVFSVAISNTDDHLRNHGFILNPGKGWKLSPAYDINPVPYGVGLQLNIDENDNSLSFDLCLEVHDYFRWKKDEAITVIKNINRIVNSWEDRAKIIGLSRMENEKLRPAFENNFLNL